VAILRESTEMQSEEIRFWLSFLNIHLNYLVSNKIHGQETFKSEVAVENWKGF